MTDIRADNQPHPIRLRYFPQIKGEQADLIVEFFMVFSRFEFALKQTGFRKIEGDGHVAPAWGAFCKSVEAKFDPDKNGELRAAFDYYLSHPPKIQVVDNQGLGWKDNNRGKDDTDFEFVIRGIKTARNNLFHGGKFPWDQIRDTTLLSHGLTLLYSFLELDRQINNNFTFVEDNVE